MTLPLLFKGDQLQAGKANDEPRKHQEQERFPRAFVAFLAQTLTGTIHRTLPLWLPLQL